MVRLNKYLASAGFGSRRAADALIAARRVRVNGALARVGHVIDPHGAVVSVDGQPIKRPTQRHLMIALNKPLGVVTTMRDERGRRTVADLLPKGQRLVPVGRLDAQTTGLLLCTSDGELAHALAHPRSGVPRTYVVRVEGAVDAPTARQLGARKTTKHNDGGTTFEVTLHEGRNRQVRRMCAQLGLRVVELRRTRYGPIELGSLRAGAWRRLTETELQRIRRRLTR